MTDVSFVLNFNSHLFSCARPISSPAGWLPLRAVLPSGTITIAGIKLGAKANKYVKDV